MVGHCPFEIMKNLRFLSHFLLLVSFHLYPQSHSLSVETISAKRLLDARKSSGFFIDDSAGGAALMAVIRKPAWDSEFWTIGDAFPRTAMDSSECFHVFAIDSISAPRSIWAAGYSPIEQQIQLVEITVDSNNTSKRQILARKAVYIRSPEAKYVFKTIFYPGTDKMVIEVNGVPMKCQAPFDCRKLLMAGFAVTGGAAVFKPLKIEGKNK